VPRDLEVICLKCLEKDSKRRYAGADALAEELNRWLAGEPISARPVGRMVRFGMWCRRNPVIAAATGLVATTLMVVAVLSLLYARQQARLAEAKTLYAEEQSRRANEHATATTKIARLNKNLEEESRDLNRRLAMLQFERAQRAFDTGQVNYGIFWLVESWRYALKADDRTWQHLARANLSFWRYNCPEIIGVFSHPATVFQVAFSPDGKTILTRGDDNTARLWDVATGRPIGQPMVNEGDIRSAAFNLDGSTILAGCSDNGARLWDAATGEPIGPALEQGGSVNSGAFTIDGKSFVTVSDNSTSKRFFSVSENTARLWRLPALVDNDLPHINVWVEAITGLAVDDEGHINALGTEPWQQRRERLGKLGGPPRTGSGYLLDPILYGPDPTARARLERIR